MAENGCRRTSCCPSVARQRSTSIAPSRVGRLTLPAAKPIRTGPTRAPDHGAYPRNACVGPSPDAMADTFDVAERVGFDQVSRRFAVLTASSGRSIRGLQPGGGRGAASHGVRRLAYVASDHAAGLRTYAGEDPAGRGGPASGRNRRRLSLVAAPICTGRMPVLRFRLWR